MRFLKAGTSCYLNIVQLNAGLQIIYIIKRFGSDNFKIGKTGDLNKRIKQLQTGNAERLYVDFAVIGDGSIEGMAKAYLKDYRLTGEWFSNNAYDKAIEFLIRYGFGKDMETMWSLLGQGMGNRFDIYTNMVLNDKKINPVKVHYSACGDYGISVTWFDDNEYAS
jgi:hypothetical protein